MRFGYVAGGKTAPPDEELKYIVSVRDQYYGWLAKLPTPVSAASHQRYGVSSTPTVAIIDRNGIIRTYNPGRMTEADLDARIAALLSTSSRRGRNRWSSWPRYSPTPPTNIAEPCSRT